MSPDQALLKEEQAPAPLFNWRTYLVIHPAAEAFPLMKDADPAAFTAFVADIKANGLRDPIVKWWSEDNSQFLIDGRNRFDALAQLGLLFETPDHHIGLRTWDAKTAKWLELSGERIVFQSLHGGDPHKIALSLNLHRRHLDTKGRRAVIDVLLKLDPGKSDRQIAEQIGSSPTTVGKQRKKAETAGDVSNLDTQEGQARPSAAGEAL